MYPSERNRRLDAEDRERMDAQNEIESQFEENWAQQVRKTLYATDLSFESWERG